MCDRMLQDSLRCYREPGRGVGVNSGPGAGWSEDSGPGAGCGFFWVRWEIFYLFAVFSPLGRDLHLLSSLYDVSIFKNLSSFIVMIK